MKIGIFDSGLGGLFIARSIIAALPDYDYVYLGDTARLPYGNRSPEKIKEFTTEALDYLFRVCNCHLVILACNTASAEALRSIQQFYLPEMYPDRRVLGVLIPMAEAVAENGAKSVGVLATSGTVKSGAYTEEIRKFLPEANISQVAAPLLVPLVEYGGMNFVEPVLQTYMNEFPEGTEVLVLGCTHYVLLKDVVRENFKGGVLSQDEIVQKKLRDYLERHPEVEKKLSRGESREYYVTEGLENAGFRDILTTDELESIKIISL